MMNVINFEKHNDKYFYSIYPLAANEKISAWQVVKVFRPQDDYHQCDEQMDVFETLQEAKDYRDMLKNKAP